VRQREGELLRNEYRRVLGFVQSRVRSPERAEDIVQEVFASMAASLARSADSAPRTLAWLYTVARRRIADEARRRARSDAVSLELVPDAEARAQEYGELVARTLGEGLAALTEAQRRVVVLRLLHGRSFAEIAARLGTTEEACRMRFLRGLEQLRAEFEQEGVTP
jgi:RNA polymerase sigma-70 factor (ECF subfamily)